ncbi:hypothetical protein [Prevotella jejuni]
MILKRNEGGIIVALPSLSSGDVKLLLPYLVAVIVKYLLMTTEVVRNGWHNNDTGIRHFVNT